MSSPPPTKPPRGVKQGKETSGLLMSVIRTLSASETIEQREKERAKLEKEYKKSDARLDELVAEHSQEILEVMQKFSSVGAALSAWGQHCDAAVARLAACQSLLRLRREDLRRLWADARTHHYALNMLTDMSRVVESEREAREALSAGRVLCAAGTLRAALAAAGGSLARVTALAPTVTHLRAMKQQLVEVIVKRLNEAVYRAERAPLARRESARRRAALQLLLAELTKSEDAPDYYLQDVTPEYEASLTEDDKTFETTVMISLEALGVLEQLKEAAEKFKCQIQNELLEVIDTTSRRIIEEGDVESEAQCEEDGETQEGEGLTETGRPLARLVACLAEEFKECGVRNKRLLQLWRAALQKYRAADSCLHSDAHYWSAVQQVLQLLLTEYLEIESVTLAAARQAGAGGGAAVGAGVGAAVGVGAGAAEGGGELRLADYFAKRRPQRRREKLFRFTVSGVGAGAGALGVGAARAQRATLVCRPEPALLYHALPALHALVAHIEALAGGGECSLRAFVTDYVRSGESERLASEARAQVEAAMRAPAAWRERAALQDRRVVFSCCSRAWRVVRGVCLAAARCGACGGLAAARGALPALAALAAHARAQHARAAPPGARAARWLADDDIVRFLQSLPNWRAAVAPDKDAAVGDADPDPLELKQAYEREAEILGSSLGDGAVARHEVIADVAALADLVVLCESMDWVATRVRSLPALLGALRPPAPLLAELAAAASAFDDVAHKCLLLLHLELRIQCFHYLGQEGGHEAGGEAEEAGGAARLAHALLAVHEHLAALPPRRAQYILHGLGEMMSAAVVWRWQGAGGAGGAGGGAGGRLATLRHCLAALRVPHDGLHRAQQYLHLLSSTVEEIIQSVQERGAQFSELEYLNAFKVIGARQGLAPADMKTQLKQLSQALGHVGVTV